MTPDQACENTAREIWREREGDFYADSIHVTQSGDIGIGCGGMVIAKSAREWHALALRQKVYDAEIDLEVERELEAKWLHDFYNKVEAAEWWKKNQ